MKITWCGHSCFFIETEDGSVVLDPYAPGSVPGFRMPALTADAVLCSHGHADHNYSEGVTFSGNSCGVKLRCVKSFHDADNGTLRGGNNIAVLNSEGLTLVHLGDLGHMLSAEQLGEIGKVDILMVPVGGHFTIDAKTAREVCRSINPSVIIPMHYRCGLKDYPVLKGVRPFLELFDPSEIHSLQDSSAVLKAPLDSQVLVFDEHKV